ncbi:MAG: hypothetical protein RBR62_01955 [Bacteroidales bacterium]|jgi:hypothetical protein|nr:hypothetical protein [Bacteroidales bacterium]
MNTSKRKIEIRLLKVQEISFYVDSSLYAEKESIKANNLNISFGLRLRPNIQHNILELYLVVVYKVNENEERKILEIESLNTFRIKNIKDLLKINEDSIEDISGIIPTLVGVAVGTIRGMLVNKTTGTPLDKYPLPMVNPETLCENILRKQRTKREHNKKQIEEKL